MSAGNFTSLIKAISVAWAASNAVNSIPLFYNTIDQSITTFPRASYKMIAPDEPEYGYNPAKFVSEYSIQFDVWDTDSDNAGLLMEKLYTLYNRNLMTLDTGAVNLALRTGSWVFEDPDLTQDSLPLYHGVCRFRFKCGYQLKIAVQAIDTAVDLTVKDIQWPQIRKYQDVMEV